MSNGKANSGSPQFKYKGVPPVAGGQSSPSVKYPGKIPSVKGDSSGEVNTTRSVSSHPVSQRPLSPNGSMDGGKSAPGPERMSITR